MAPATEALGSVSASSTTSSSALIAACATSLRMALAPPYAAMDCGSGVPAAKTIVVSAVAAARPSAADLTSERRATVGVSATVSAVSRAARTITRWCRALP